MAWYWIMYWVSLAVVVIFTLLVKLLFTYEGEEFHVAYIVVLDLIAAIPFLGTFEAFILVGIIFIGVVEADLEPKY